MFFKGSRYEQVGTTSIADASGRTVAYKLVRFIPDTAAVSGHLVTSGERLDHISWLYFKDAERFWRICDANRALWPDDLLEEAAIIRIPQSEG